MEFTSRTRCLALTLGLFGCMAAPDEDTASERQSVATNPAVTPVPVVVHVVVDGTRLDRFMPGYEAGGALVTGDSVRATLFDVSARFNSPFDFPLQVVMTRYVRDDGVTPCETLTAVPPALLEVGTLHVVASGRCGATLPEGSRMILPYSGDAAVMARRVGRALGLRATGYHRDDVALREPLARDLDDTHAGSCYRTGDGLCDTPPDYGRASAQSTPPNTCPRSFREPGDDPFYCEQLGAPCSTAPASNDAFSCVNVGAQGRRWYAADRFGYASATTELGPQFQPRWVMSESVTGPGFSIEQARRARTVARWRMHQAIDTSAANVRLLHDTASTPTPDLWWNTLAPQGHRLAAVDRRMVQVSVADAPLIAGAREVQVPVPGDAGRILGWRMIFLGGLEVYPTTRVTVTPPWGTRIDLPYQSARDIDDVMVSFDEAYAEGQTFVDRTRGFRAAGTWRVRVEDPQNPTSFAGIWVEFYLRRGDGRPDGDGDGLDDVMVYRSADGVYTQRNLAPTSVGFGAATRAQTFAPTFESMHAGDVDGDGRADLVALSRIGQMQVALSREALGTWRPATLGAATSVSAPRQHFAVADFDNDGPADLLYLSATTGPWRFFRSRADGNFSAGVDATFAGTLPSFADVQVMAGDLSRDGRADLLVRDRTTDRTWFFLNTTSGPGGPVTFAAPAQVYLGGALTSSHDADALRLVDVDADGRVDLLVRRAGTGVWSYYRALTATTFAAGVLVSLDGNNVAWADSDVVLP